MLGWRRLPRRMLMGAVLVALFTIPAMAYEINDARINVAPTPVARTSSPGRARRALLPGARSRARGGADQLLPRRRGSRLHRPADLRGRLPVVGAELRDAASNASWLFADIPRLWPPAGFVLSTGARFVLADCLTTTDMPSLLGPLVDPSTRSDARLSMRWGSGEVPVGPPAGLDAAAPRPIGLTGPAWLQVPRLGLAQRPLAARWALGTVLGGVVAIVAYATAGQNVLMSQGGLTLPTWVPGPLHHIFGGLPIDERAISVGFSLDLRRPARRLRRAHRRRPPAFRAHDRPGHRGPARDRPAQPAAPAHGSLQLPRLRAARGAASLESIRARAGGRTPRSRLPPLLLAQPAQPLRTAVHRAHLPAGPSSPGLCLLDREGDDGGGQPRTDRSRGSVRAPARPRSPPCRRSSWP